MPRHRTVLNMKQCQSCGMPLETAQAGDCRGTEADGSKAEKWCSLCYRDGSFIDPSCTLPDMLKIVDNALKNNGSSRAMRWMAAKQLPTLERWQT